MELSEEEKKAIELLKNEIEEKSTIIMAGAEKIKRLESQVEELLNVLNNEKKINYIKPIDIEVHNYISKDKIREKIDKYRKKIEKLHSQELWNEPEDSIKDFKYNHYLEAYKKLLEEN